jgi:hypothetical protein
MIQVDRLILDVPGMTPGRAERLAHAIGALLGESGAAPAEQVDALVPPGAATDAAILAALAAALHARAA